MLEVFLTRFNAESRKGIKIHNALELFRPIRFILLQRKLRLCTYMPLNLLLYWTYDQGISPHVYKINICLSAKSSYKNACLQVNLLSSLFAQSLQKGLGDRTKLQHREKYINVNLTVSAELNYWPLSLIKNKKNVWLWFLQNLLKFHWSCLPDFSTGF